MLLKRFLPRITFDSYEDFKENYRVNIPEDFNFGFDIVDAWAELDKNKVALIWCDDHGHEKTFTFEEIKKLSNKTANYLKSLGIKKGDVVMLILRRRWEYWICATALHKLGAILIPGSLQLTKKEIIFRAEAADIKTIICVDDAFVIEQVEQAMQETKVIENRILVDIKRDGWLSFEEGIAAQSEDFPRPVGDEATRWDDTMVVYLSLIHI